MKLSRAAALLLCLILFIPLCGCEKIDLSGNKTPSASSADDRVLTVKTTVSGRFSFRPEAGLSQQGDRILQLFAEAEKQTGTLIDVEIMESSNLSSAFQRAARTGKKFADLIQTDAGFFTEQYAADMILPLSDAGIEESETGVLRFEGKAYAFRADGWNAPPPTASYLMYYNSAILEDAGCVNPMESYEKRVWNWDQFLSAATTVSRLSAEGDVLALCAPTAEEPALMWATLHAAGAVYFDETGCVMDTAAARNGFAKLRELADQRLLYELYSEPYDTNDRTAQKAFTNRRTAFLVDNAALLYQTGAGSLSEELGEALRMIPFPTIPGGPENTLAFTRDDLFLGVPKKANVTLCKKVLPLLLQTPEGTDPSADLTEAFFFYEEDAQVYQALLASARTDTSLLFGENRSMVEEFFLQVVGGASSKEILSNLQTIFNAQKG